MRVENTGIVITCPGCEKGCYEEVVTIDINNKIRGFIVCSDHDMQGQIGRLRVDLDNIDEFNLKN